MRGERRIFICEWEVEDPTRAREVASESSTVRKQESRKSQVEEGLVGVKRTLF